MYAVPAQIAQITQFWPVGSLGWVERGRLVRSDGCMDSNTVRLYRLRSGLTPLRLRSPYLRQRRPRLVPPTDFLGSLLRWVPCVSADPGRPPLRPDLLPCHLATTDAFNIVG